MIIINIQVNILNRSCDGSDLNKNSVANDGILPKNRIRMLLQLLLFFFIVTAIVIVAYALRIENVGVRSSDWH